MSWQFFKNKIACFLFCFSGGDFGDFCHLGKFRRAILTCAGLFLIWSRFCRRAVAKLLDEDTGGIILGFWKRWRFSQSPSQKWNSSVKRGNGLWPVCLKKTLAFIENFNFDVWSFLYSEDWRVLWKTAYILLMHASGLARIFGRAASVSCDNLPFYAFTTMIISLRKTVPCGNADRKGDKQASLSLIFTIVLWNSCPNPNLPISRYSICSENF